MRKTVEVAVLVLAGLTVVLGLPDARRVASIAEYTGWQAWAFAAMVQLPLFAGTARAISIAHGDPVVHRLEVWAWVAWVVVFTLGTDVLAGLEVSVVCAVVHALPATLVLVAWGLPFVLARAEQ